MDERVILDARDVAKQVHLHWTHCMQCYCSVSRAGVLTHMQNQLANEAARLAEFTSNPVPEPEPVPVSSRPDPSGSDIANTERRLHENAGAFYGRTSGTEARRGLQNLLDRASFGRTRQLAQDEPPIKEAQRDRLCV
jgi:hypothetical protein